jgi:hypothetical protein
LLPLAFAAGKIFLLPAAKARVAGSKTAGAKSFFFPQQKQGSQAQKLREQNLFAVSKTGGVKKAKATKARGSKSKGGKNFKKKIMVY